MSAGHDDHGHEPTSFWTKYVFSIDHKVIGSQFTFTALLFVILGGLLALGVRYQLAWPQQELPYAGWLPGTGADEGRSAQPVSMSARAPEANVALWDPGHEVELNKDMIYRDGKWSQFSYDGFSAPIIEANEKAIAEAVASAVTSFKNANADATDDAIAKETERLTDLETYKVVAKELKKHAVFPKGTKGNIENFPLGLAITLPAGTQVEDSGGNQRALDENMSAFVDKIKVMADYNPNKTEIIAVYGTAVREDNGGESGNERTLHGRVVYRPGAQAGIYDTEDDITVPLRRPATMAKVNVNDQSIKIADTSLLKNFGLSPTEYESYLGKYNSIVAANGATQADTDQQITDNQKAIDEAVAAHGENSLQATKLREKAEAITADGQSKLQPEVIDVAIKGIVIEKVSAGDIDYYKQTLTSDGYNQLFTMHASVMIFLVIIPMLVGGFGNWSIPLMIGARDMAFPRINMLSFWLAFAGGIIMLVSFWVAAGPAGGGWTMYPPLSEAQFSSNLGTTLWLLAVFLIGFSSIVGSLNYMTTIVNMRAPGMSMFRMPLTVWSMFITSILQLFATPVLAAAGIMMVLDRNIGTIFFNPAEGGQALLWQHLFWFYSHPAVYIMILPTMGLASDVLATFARKPIFGYKPMVFAMGGITGLGYIVWGHHMFQSGMNPILGTTFMASTIMIAVPSAIKVFNWLGTLWGGNIQYTPAMLNAIGFVSMFTIGGLSGIFMACAPVDIPIHDTYFIVAHIHYVLFGGSIFGIFAGIYHWFPKWFGRKLNPKWGVIHFVMTIIAFNGTFFIMHALGVGGHPRRYATQLNYPTLEHLQPMNVVMTICAMMLGMAQIPFFYNFFVSLPRKLGRSMVTFFTVMLGLPIVVGLSAWGVSSEAGSWISWLCADPETGYTGFQKFFGNLVLWATIIGVGCHMFAGLHGQGRAWLCIVLATFIYLWKVSGDWDLTAVGFGAFYMWVVMAAMLVVWEVGGAFKVKELLQRIMYFIFLPAFLAPLIMKQDPYIWLGMPEMFAYKWHLLILSGIPGAAYCVVRRPVDIFGAIAGDNPWLANSLEWCTTSPPPLLNFDEIPTVHRGPYEYSSPVVEKDWITQVEELPPGVVEPAGH